MAPRRRPILSVSIDIKAESGRAISWLNPLEPFSDDFCSKSGHSFELLRRTADTVEWLDSQPRGRWVSKNHARWESPSRLVETQEISEGPRTSIKITSTIVVSPSQAGCRLTWESTAEAATFWRRLFWPILRGRLLGDILKRDTARTLEKARHDLEHGWYVRMEPSRPSPPQHPAPLNTL